MAAPKSSSSLKIFASATLVCAALLRVASAAQSVVLSNDPLWTAQSVIKAFFPDLGGREFHMRVFFTDRFDIEWTTPRFLRQFGLAIEPTNHDVMKGESAKTVDTSLLQAYCLFDQIGIDSISMTGQMVRERENYDLRQEIDQHQGWTDLDVLTALDASGARFGPGAEEEVRRSIPLRDLNLILGGNSQVISAQFESRSGNDPGFRTAEMTWTVLIEVVPPGRRSPSRYVLLFEPLGGKFRQIVRSH